MTDYATSKVVRWITSIHTNADPQTGVEFKPLVILAALELLESEPNHSNFFSYEELFTVFKELAEEKGLSHKEKRFSEPYTRLKNSKKPIQVWIPQPADGVDINQIDSSSGNPAAVRRGIPYIKIDDAVWPAFLSQEGRNEIRKAINERLFPSMIQGSLFEQLEIGSNGDSLKEDISGKLNEPQENPSLTNLISTYENLPSTDDYLIDEEENKPENQDYTLKECAKETNFAEDKLKQWIEAIKYKRQAILYGPPGTGKTFIAEHLARHLVGGDNGFYEIVQFHPAYTYEDFIKGIRPMVKQDGGLVYRPVEGRFLDFCTRAEKRKGICVLIIDEINRANLPQVFGELMYLLEYREKKIPLAIGSNFYIPKNVFVIGTMNTADRSIALVDYAIRRRFAFIAMRPDYDILRRYYENRSPSFSIDKLVDTLKRVNQEINDPNYEIGVSFFLPQLSEHNLELTWKTEIEPYLEEYFFARRQSLEQFKWDKIKTELLP
jgi:DNA polymerase III delta prime subunit